MFKKLKITHKLTTAFVLVGILPLLAVTIFVQFYISERLQKEGIEKMEVMEKSKTQQIKTWAAEYKKSIEFMAGTEIISSRFQILKQYHDQNQVPEDAPFPVETEEYKKLWEEISPKMLQIQEQFNVDDILIICAAHGHVMYSNTREKDLGANLVHGLYKETSLAKAWKQAKETKKTAAIDFEPYAPSNNVYASFIATPFFDRDGNMLGIVGVRASHHEINLIMQDRTGMGNSGESYLVGKHNDKISFRSDLVTMGEGQYVLGYEIHTEYIENVIVGQEGNGIFIDSAGKKVLVSYSPVDILGFNWGCISKINLEEIQQTAVRLRNILFLVLVGMGILVLVMARLIAGGISRPIKQIVSISHSLGEGDLTRRVNIDRGDELGDLSHSLDRSIDQLAGLVKTVMNASGDIITSSDELAGGSSELASRTQQQAASLTETSATIEQFSTAVKQNSRNAEELNASVKSFNGVLQTNQKLVEDVSATMRQIDESGKRIDAIVNVINDISFQTNLLALNAAVEAARAGEAGRGFAVVASEVRNLAQKTAESSKTIQEIITQNVESTQQGMELVRKTSDSFTQIVKMMEDLVVKINGISTATNEQTTGIEQINTTISQMEEVVNYNASMSEEFSASSDYLKQNARQLQDIVKQFKLDETG